MGAQEAACAGPTRYSPPIPDLSPTWTRSAATKRGGEELLLLLFVVGATATRATSATNEAVKNFFICEFFIFIYFNIRDSD